jgi:hypothetical protein
MLSAHETMVAVFDGTSAVVTTVGALAAAGDVMNLVQSLASLAESFPLVGPIGSVVNGIFSLVAVRAGDRVRHSVAI